MPFVYKVCCAVSSLHVAALVGGVPLLMGSCCNASMMLRSVVSVCDCVDVCVIHCDEWCEGSSQSDGI